MTIRDATRLKRSDTPLQDDDTRTWLKGEGFDLSRPISWEFDASTGCRRFGQDIHELRIVPD